VVEVAGTSRRPVGVEYPRLDRIESFGWCLLRAVRPYCLIAIVGSATLHLVMHPSGLLLGAGGTALVAATLLARRREQRKRAPQLPSGR
jgi:hypothetical protein